MNRLFSILLTLLLSLCTARAAAPLDSLFHAVSAFSEASATEVKYTGMYDGNMPGFIYQRGSGSGWTEGMRLSCPGVTPKMAEALFNDFDKCASESGYTISLDSDRACFDESDMTVYACHYQADTSTLQFLRAIVEDQICVPYDWYERDFYDGSLEKIERQLSPAEWVAALATLNTELKYNYVFYDRFKSEIDSAYRAILPAMARVPGNYEAVQLLNRFIASCHDGHTRAYGSGIIEQPVCSPFTTRLIDGRVYIDRVESQALADAGMNRGMEVVAVNGLPVKQYTDSFLRPFASSSTPQWTDYLVFDRYGLSTGRKGAPLNLTLADGHRTVQISHNIGSGKRDLPSPPDRFNFRKIEGNIGLLRIPDFQSAAVTEMFDKVYGDILGTDAIIIDIRGNGGGNSSYANYIARHFSADSIASDSWRTPVYNPAFASWGYDRSWFEEPSEPMPPVADKDPYLKPVVILIDRGTFSSAEDFSALFKGMKRAVFIGTPTGGSTGNAVRVQLNPLAMANICSKHDKAPDGTEFVGIGIQPDILVTESPDTYLSPTGTDSCIRAALDFLKR